MSGIVILTVNGESKLKKASTCMSSSILCEDEYLHGEFCEWEIEKCICKLKHNKTGGNDGLVGELLKYGE